MHRPQEVVVARLLEGGYVAGRPPWVSPEEEEIDRAICGRSPCTLCRHKGLEYHPFYRGADRSYRVVVVCFECGHARETGDGAPVEVMRPILPGDPGHWGGLAS